MYLELSGLKHIKSMRVQTTRLAILVKRVSSLSNLSFLWWSTHEFSLDKIGCLTRNQWLWLSNCKDVEELNLIELKLLQWCRL